MKSKSLLIALAGTLISCGGLTEEPGWPTDDPASKADLQRDDPLFQERCDELLLDGYTSLYRQSLEYALVEANPLLTLQGSSFDEGQVELEAVLEGAPASLISQALTGEASLFMYNLHEQGQRGLASRALAVIAPSPVVTSYDEQAGTLIKTFYQLHDEQAYRAAMQLEQPDPALVDYFARYLSLVNAVIGFRQSGESLASDYPQPCSEDWGTRCYRVPCREVFSWQELQDALATEDGCVWLNGLADSYAHTCSSAEPSCDYPTSWTESAATPPVCVDL